MRRAVIGVDPVLEVAQHGQHAPVRLVGGRQAELEEDVRHVLLDGALGDDERLGDQAVGAALGHQPEHLALARGERFERVLRPERTSSWVTTSGSSAAPPAATRRSASRNSRDVGDAVLEQVADAAAVAGQQVDGVALLDVLGEHQQRHVRPLLADHERGPHALVGERRRHPDVDDADVGLVRARRRAAAPRRRRRSRRPRSRPRSSSRARPSRSSTASSAITARMAAPLAGSFPRRAGSTTMQVAVDGAHAVAQAAEADAGRESAPPTPLSSTSTTSRSPLVLGGQPGAGRLRRAWRRWSAPRRRRSRRSPRCARPARCGRSTSTATGTGQRAASAETAASRPRSVSTAGWMPRARLRSSTSASLASPCASSTSVRGERRVLGRLARGRASSPARRAAAARRRAGRARSGGARRRRRRPCRRGSPRACPRGRSGARARPARAAAAPSRPARRRRRAPATARRTARRRRRRRGRRAAGT